MTGPLGPEDRDPRGRCCPPGKGCNAPSHDLHLCGLTGLERCADRQAVREARHWWRRWRSLPWWRALARREAWRAHWAARERAYAVEGILPVVPGARL
jgi:hypothetical protein